MTSSGETVNVPALQRRLGLRDATLIGLGSMLGAGVFAAYTPAAQAAGSGLLVGLLVAAVVAFCNAAASAQLAAEYPTSGGTYVFGRVRLGPWWGFVAGWSFVVGKTASCAAMALTFGAYIAPAGWDRPIAVAAVVVLGVVNYRGITRTARVSGFIVVAVILVLGTVVASGLSTGFPAAPEVASGLLSGGVYGILQSAGLLFFAFAGYARIATLGEEVRNPTSTIPRAILLALGICLVLYAAVATVALLTLGPEQVADAEAPLADVTAAAGWTWALPVVRIGGALASLGALLALIAGIGRTALAMAREGDLPRWLSAIHPRFSTPHRAELVLVVVVVGIVLFADVRGAIGFSSFGVLLYYLVANLSAFTQSRRLYSRGMQVVGIAGCTVLAFTLPLVAVATGIAVVLLGCLYRVVRLRLGTSR